MPRRKTEGRSKGTGNINKIRNRFYLRSKIAGKTKNVLLRNQDSSPCKNRLEAERAAKLLEPVLLADQKEKIAFYVAEARKLKKKSRLPLSSAWDIYLKQPNRPDSGAATLATYKTIFDLFLEWLKETRPELQMAGEVTAETAQDYFSHLWTSGISARTYNSYLSTLRLIFHHLKEPGALEENPFDSIVKKTQETASRNEFTEEEIKAIFDGFERGFYYDTYQEKLTKGRERVRKAVTVCYTPMHADEMRVLLNLCCWTGCRGQDGCLMQWKNIDLDKEIISYIPHKTARRTGGKAVTLPLHFNLKSALEDALKWRKSNRSGEDYILPNVAARYRHNPSGIQKDVMKIIRCATGLETTAKSTSGRRKLAANAYSLHSFRHSFVSFCSNSGVPLAIVAEIVGHGNPAMTRHYSHISTEAKQDAIARLPMLNIPDKAVVELTHPLNDADEETRILREKLLFSIRVSDLERLKKIEESINPYLIVQQEFEF